MNNAADQSKKQDAVQHGMRLFERIEDAFDQLHDLWEAGREAGLMDVNQCHDLQNWALELKYATLRLHCQGTAIAKRNNCDVPAGDAVLRGGPGR
jgi:hypothetical protein